MQKRTLVGMSLAFVMSLSMAGLAFAGPDKGKGKGKEGAPKDGKEQAAILEKYDENKNGKLDENEKAKMKEAKKKEKEAAKSKGDAK